jgi:hypothetical protein
MENIYHFKCLFLIEEVEVEEPVDTAEVVEFDQTTEIEDVEDIEEIVPEEVPSEVSEEEALLSAIDDLATPLVQLDKPKTKEKKQVVVVQPAKVKETTEDEDEDSDKRHHKGKQLVFDEKRGQVVTKRKRKGSRRRPEWETYGDDVLEDEY